MSSDKLCDESVWNEQLEEAFHEALNLYPSGRKKIILTDAGKMYGKHHGTFRASVHFPITGLIFKTICDSLREK
jgi:hypothetical protein